MARIVERRRLPPRLATPEESRESTQVDLCGCVTRHARCTRPAGHDGLHKSIGINFYGSWKRCSRERYSR